MRRALALLLVPALIATSGVASLLHTHAYRDHHHPEHEHGLSAHEHRGTSKPAVDGADRVERCDPAGHVVSFKFLCEAAPQAHTADAEFILPAAPCVEMQVQRGLRHQDVRVHGPPPRTQGPPRAPPLIAHA